MPMTITEKIISRASRRSSVTPGDYVEATSPCPTLLAHNSLIDKGAGLLVDLGRNVYEPNRVILVDGHLGATASHNVAELRVAARQWAAQVGISEENIYDLGRAGIETMVAVENGWPLPGELYLQGVNGHVSTVGALGAFPIALSFGTAAYLLSGRTWLKVPKTLRIELAGEPHPSVFTRDVSEYVISQVGPIGAVGYVIEWAGPYIDSLTMDERLGLCSQALFTGAWTSIMNPDDLTIAFVRDRTSSSFDPLYSDADADYAGVLSIDVSQVEPQVAVPPTRHDIRPVRTLEGMPINRGFVGSDANGWLTDLRLVADVVRGKKISRRVMLNVTPGTVDILRQAVQEGVFLDLLEAECVIPSPCEGMEWGANTPLGPGDVCVATGQTNYPGRMGSVDAKIYLASPATVSASCLFGELRDPRSLTW
jgi:3-isopropylmalate/(R)-2-methylmalate dehydratase large subunit